MADTFSVSMLTSIWASNSKESKRMRKVAPVAVFSFKDRHSDELCYKTISKDLEQILQETKDVLVTLVPVQYRTFTAEAKTPFLLGRPLYITTYANGNFLFTGKEKVIGVFISGSDNKQLGWITRKTISEVQRMGSVEDLKISLITFEEKEISFQ
ncbi:hypothetical protein ACROYT_G015666 [Oculina patagonica]